tara:strand:- start:296 stop:532 length:237 start_codon:yes stop_codon:yes gene_type:complete
MKSTIDRSSEIKDEYVSKRIYNTTMLEKDFEDSIRALKAARDFTKQRVALERRYARDCENLRKRAEKSIPTVKTLGRT